MEGMTSAWLVLHVKVETSKLCRNQGLDCSWPFGATGWFDAPKRNDDARCKPRSKFMLQHDQA